MTGDKGVDREHAKVWDKPQITRIRLFILTIFVLRVLLCECI